LIAHAGTRIGIHAVKTQFPDPGELELHDPTRPTGISVTASDSRSQFQNRTFALERLLDVFEK
jgi:hypothetical protein